MITILLLFKVKVYFCKEDVILLTFEFNSENLIFREIRDELEEEMLIYGLFREDGTRLGTSVCNLSKYDGHAWYLDNIYILPEFEKMGYGTQLLEITCETLWQIKRVDIVLERPGDTVAPDGFARRDWYERHGFESCPAPLTFMIRKP